MRAWTGLPALFFLAFAATQGLGGCAAIPVGVAVAEAGSGVSFTSSTAYRSFTYSRDRVRAAALQALELMRITKTREQKSGDDIKMRGKTKHLSIYITLASITPTVTKASVKAKKNWFMKDMTVSAEILFQMDQVLGRADSGPYAGPRRGVQPSR